MANKKITDLTAAAALTGAELLEGVQGGASVRLATAAVAGLALPSVVAEPTTARTALPTHANQYTRFTATSAKTWTFDSAQNYAVGSEFHARNVGAGNLTLDTANGFTLHAPAGGTLVVPPGGTVTIKIVAPGEADVFGLVEASP